jgi:NADPH:quinone reductase-like Zn-dependent oxidoreductase
MDLTLAPMRSLGVARPGELRFFEEPSPPLDEGQFRVATLYSGLSAGTEISFLRGTNPYLVSCWDDDLCVFSADGTPQAAYPVRSLGYMETGRVVESRSDTVAEGDLVAMRYGHKTGHVGGPGDICVPVPDDVDPVLGIYVAQMGPICANGLLHAAAQLCGPGVDELGEGVRGQKVLVVGAGVVGLLTGLLARHHGADEVVMADPTPDRLDAARKLGLDVIDERADEAWRVCKDRWRHGPRDRGADLVFQCRGRTSCLAGALRALRPQGTVIDLAFYQGGADDVHLGQEFHHNGLTVCSAQIARVPRGLSDRWDRPRLSRETLGLLAAHGPAIREALVTDVVDISEAMEAMTALSDRRRHAIQVVFRFPEADGSAALPY